MTYTTAKKIENILFNINKDLIGRSGINFIKLANDWNFIVGKEFSLNTVPLKIAKIKVNSSTNNVLYIAVNNSSLITEYHYLKGLFIEKINFYFGFEYIHKINYKFLNFKTKDTFEEPIPLVLNEQQQAKIDNLTANYPSNDKIKELLKEIAKEFVKKKSIDNNIN